MTEPSNIVSFPQSGSAEWITSYHQACLTKRNDATIDAYLRILRQLMEWVTNRPGYSKQFRPDYLTTTVVEGYLSHLKERGYSVSHRTRVKSVIKQFCQWLIDEKEVLKRNPARAIEIKTQQALAPRVLSPDQRFVLRNLVEKADDLRGKALFALGYWAGCRVSDVAHLSMEHAHIGPKIGWLHVGYKGEKFRDIDLLNEAVVLSMSIFSMVDAILRASTSLLHNGVFISPKMAFTIGFVLSSIKRTMRSGS